MRRHTLFFLALALVASLVGQAQTITELPTWYIYPGNPGEKILPIAPLDSTKPATAVLYADANGRALAPSLQPVLTRSGLLLTIRWAVTTGLPATAYLKVSFGSRIFYGIPIDVSVKNVNRLAAGSPTLLYPVPVALPGSGVSSGQVGTVLYYDLSLTNTGYAIQHNQFTRLVTGAAFQQDTGLLDDLWRVEVTSDNAVILRGPPNEHFTGKLVLTFYKQPTQ